MKTEIEKKLPEIPIVSFTSGKGGCGKTTIAVNFAYSLFKANSSNKVLIIDLDISNRGSTGIFSKWTKTINDSLTLTRILHNEQNAYVQNTIQIEDGFYFIPASCNQEMAWSEPKNYNLNDFVDNLRDKLLLIGKELGVQCIVLDCFCGIDLLTTAGSACADHTIIINEPDIVTFTGSLSLKVHLDRAFEKLERKPQLYFVINRVRSNQKVKDLNALYEQNLLKEVNNAVLTYIPYNNKIFNNFGSYPFFVNLIPNSLFTQKIEQIAYVLFVQTHPKLVRPSVRQWSVRKFESVYLRSIDKSAVDTEYLIVRLISVPVLIGLLGSLSFVVTYFKDFTPQVAWGFFVLVTVLMIVIYITRLLSTAWVMARLHFTLAAFLYRLGLRSRFKEARLKELAKTILPFLSGVFILASILFLIIMGITISDYAYRLLANKQKHTFDYVPQHGLLDYLNNEQAVLEAKPYQFYTELAQERHPYFRYYKDEIRTLSTKEKLIQTGFVYTAFELPSRSLDLSNYTLANVSVNSKSGIWGSPHYKNDTSYFENVNTNNTCYNYCKLPQGFLNNRIVNNTFNYCEFNTKANLYFEIEDQYVHSQLKPTFTSIAHTVSNAGYYNVNINGLVLDGIFFYQSAFSEVSISLNSNDFIALWDCEIEGLEIRHMEQSTGGKAYVFANDDIARRINVGEGIEVLPLFVFKDIYYEEVYLNNIDTETKVDLYASIIKYERALNLSLVTDRRRSLTNLSEAYMMTYEPEFSERIHDLLNELSEEIQIQKVGNAGYIPARPSDIGIFYLLQTYFAILNNNTYEIKEWFNKYKNWIYISDDNAIKQNLGLWKFTSWNEHMRINGDKLEPRQIDMYFLLQRMVHDDGLTKLKSEQELSKFLNENVHFDREMKMEQLTNVYYENERLSKIKRSKR